MEENKKSSTQFQFNRHYFYMGIYIILIVAVSAIIIRFAFDWTNMSMVLKKIFNVITPFILGAFLAFILNPLVNWFKSAVFKKAFRFKNEKLVMYLSILLTYVVVIGLLVVLIMYVAPQIYNSIVSLTGQINTLYENTTSILERFQTEHTELTFIDYDKLADTINNAVPQIIGYLSDITGSIVPFLYTAASSFVKTLYNILIAIIVSIYIIADQKTLIMNIKRLTYALLPEKGRVGIIDVLNQTIRIFNDFVRGKAIDSLIIGMINFVLMNILGLKFSVLISVIVGITNMIPYFGPFIGGGVGAVIILITSPIKALVFAVMILVLQQFDGNYLGPKILGHSIGIKPLWIIFAITIGGSIGGFVGMFLGVPCIAIISYVLDKYISVKLRQKNVSVEDGRFVVGGVGKKETSK